MEAVGTTEASPIKILIPRTTAIRTSQRRFDHCQKRRAGFSAWMAPASAKGSTVAAAPIEETVPVEEAVPVEETFPVEETVPVEETLSANGNAGADCASKDDRIPADSTVAGSIAGVSAGSPAAGFSRNASEHI